MGYFKHWKPSKTAIKEYARKMDEINEFCQKNSISQSTSSDSYYFDINGQSYRVSNHSVEASKYHHGRKEDTIYIHASKTRIIEIYENLKAGKKLDGFGNIKGGNL